MFAKKLAATGVVILVALGLTACDPPMPPELLAAQAEQTVNCIDGSLTVATPEAVVDVIEGWGSSIADTCSGMGLNRLKADDQSAQAAIVMDGQTSPKWCAPFATFPIGVDAGVVAYALTDAPTLNLTPQNVQDIFSGKVIKWNDPSLAGANPDAVLPDLPINIVGTPTKAALDALAVWFKTSGVAFTPTLVDAATADNGAYLSSLNEGDIAITSFSNALYAFSTVAAITLGSDSRTQSAIADSSGIQRGADKTSGVAAVDEAPAYLATYPINMYLCGSDNNVARAVGRFLIRQDAQGVLGSALIAPLPEKERLKAIAIVEKGLPKAIQ